VGAIGYAGYALATEGWMMFAWLSTWLLGALVMPSTQALMSHRVAADSQGELQGAVAGPHSLSSIIAPPLMTQMFRRFTAAGAPVHLPGAPFLLASALAVGAMVVFFTASRSDASEEGAM
jgi:DHA1 family tetracycline resistance protein-like MFS transporter